MSTIAESMRGGAQALARHSESPLLDAALLLAKVLGLPRSALLLRHDDPVAAANESQYLGLLQQRISGAPIAYLTGTREFWSLPLKVTPAVLVPRPETELLVECALARVTSAQRSTILDLGTGSGAIALAVATERPLACVTGVDISPAALAVAETNSRTLGVANVEWRSGTWFEPVASQRFDLILSNPPYIACTDEALLRLAAEPTLALSPGPTGFEALEAIIERAPLYLNAGGWLILEHGSDQSSRLTRLFAEHGFNDIRTCNDFSDKPRVTLGTIHSHQ